MKRIYPTILCLFFVFTLQAQSFDWLISGSGNVDATIQNERTNIFGLKSDSSYIYVSGLISSNDFYTDNSIAMFADHLITENEYAFIGKFDHEGNEIWITQSRGWGRNPIALAKDGSIYQAYTDKFGNNSAIAKYSPDGDLIWEKELMEKLVFVRTYSIAIDNNDDIILCGYWQPSDNTHTIGDTVLVDLLTYNSAGFVMKLDSLGDLVWVNTTRGKGNTVFRDLAIDKNNEIVVSGEFMKKSETGICFGDTCLMGYTDNIETIDFYNTDPLIAKLDTKGSFIWAVDFGGRDEDFGGGVAINSENQIVCVGSAVEEVSFQSINWARALQLKVAKLEEDGTMLWKCGAGGLVSEPFSNSDQGVAVAIDEDDNIYVGGNMYKPKRNKKGSIEEQYSGIVRSYPQAGFIGKYSDEGELLDQRYLYSVEASINNICINTDEMFFGGSYHPPASFFNVEFDNSEDTPGRIRHLFFSRILLNGNHAQEKRKPKSSLLFPNPAFDEVYVIDDAISLPAVFHIYDSHGRNVLGGSIESYIQSINLRSLTPGCYYLKVVNDNDQITAPVIKQ